MYTNKTFPLRIILFFCWRELLWFTLLSVVVLAVYKGLGWTFVAIPFLPVATIGTAVAFYVGFKNNSSYERLWEARRIWGAITNASRSWATLVNTTVGRAQYDDNPDAIIRLRRQLILRQVGWVNALRLQLRRRVLWQEDPTVRSLHVKLVEQQHRQAEEMHATLAPFLPSFELACTDCGATNVPNLLLHAHAAQLADLKTRGLLDAFEHAALSALVVECFAQQGGAERIKSFPFPRQYAHFSTIFVGLFTFLLPFALIGEMAKFGPNAVWLALPFSVLISWVFFSMESVGDASENPFENGLNDVPMSAICRNIEIDLRELLGDTPLPERLQAVDGVLL
ncbi:bestrophin family protein [uncultured Hymenobacter sp.]|uniref:bestrophin family protein n=1 Tax=uncultured Hymenobacter sp. TaxID=170016 RepID=UPI0035CC34EB